MTYSEWIAVDWGTSNLRAWGITDGSIRFERKSDKGMGKLARHEFAEALIDLLFDLMPSPRPIDVFICGMAGARQGWLEAPYLEAPTELIDLAQGAVKPEMPDAYSHMNVVILPGVCQRNGRDDLMRGEETQLLGLANIQPNFQGVVCMPGTHTKWVHLEGTRISKFSTAMSGELFEILRTYSVLTHALQGDRDGPGHKEGFDAGARVGLDDPQQLLSRLFEVRAGSLLSGREPDWCAGFLSGLLIGSEIGGTIHLLGDAPVPLIGSPTLCEAYARTLALAGVTAVPLDVTTIVLAGLKAARARAL